MSSKEQKGVKFPIRSPSSILPLAGGCRIVPGCTLASKKIRDRGSESGTRPTSTNFFSFFSFPVVAMTLSLFPLKIVSWVKFSGKSVILLAKLTDIVISNFKKCEIKCFTSQHT